MAVTMAPRATSPCGSTRVVKASVEGEGRVGAGRNGHNYECSVRMSFEDHLSDSARADLATRGSHRTFRPGEIAFLQGERAGRCAVVVTGVFKVTAASVDGRSAFLDLRRRGDGVGLLEALDGGPRTSTVTAMTPTSVRMMGLSEFRNFLSQHRSAQAASSLVVADRVRTSIEDRLRSCDAAPVRLANSLLRLAADHGEPQPDGAIVIGLPLTQDDLAMIITTSRDSVAKTLMIWRRQRIVETGRRQLTIIDPERLLDLR